MTKKNFFRFLLRGCLLLLGCLFFSLPNVTVQAHANLDSSDPETGTALTKAPNQAVLQFTEPLDEGFSKARLVDSNNAVVDPGPGIVDPANNHILRLKLPALLPGAYSIIWQARSAADGHITDGIISFTVGTGASPDILLSATDAGDPTKAVPSGLDALLRWLRYLAAALMAGSIFFGVLVWRPAYRAWKPADDSADRDALKLLSRLAMLGILLLFGFSLAYLVFQVWQLVGGMFQISYGSAFVQLIDLRNGWIFWLRLLLLILLAERVKRLSLPGSGTVDSWVVASVLVVNVLLLFSLQSHAAALANPLPILNDGVHIIAMAGWLGGLLPLFLSLRAASIPAQLLVPKFSRLALTCVAALALTGFYSAILQVGSLPAMFETFYGKTLAFKTLLFGALICLGALNLLFLSPRLRSMGQQAGRWLKNSMRIEMLLGLFVLAAVGVMASGTPASEAVQARNKMGYIDTYRENGRRIDLWVAPARVGNNAIAVDLVGFPAGNQDTQPIVLFRLSPTNSRLGVTQVETKPTSPTRYMAQGSYLSLSGLWNVEVIVRQPGQNDIHHIFTVQVSPSTFLASLVNPVEPTDGSITAGRSLYQANCLPCHGIQGKGDGPAGLALRPSPADLTIHTTPGVHTDGQLFEWITNGYPGTAMPAFKDQLDEEQRWHLVNFIRTLSLQK